MKLIADDFELVQVNRLSDVRAYIKSNEGKVIQQVAYSTYHDALTVINFTDKAIVTNMDLEQIENSWNQEETTE